MGWSKSSKKGRQVPITTTTRPSTASSSAGCMTALFQFFDFHHFQFPLHHQTAFKPADVSLHLQQQLLHDHIIPKGAEAPRNSLELNQSPLPYSFIKKEDNSNIIQVGKIQIKTRPKLGDSSDVNISSSPSSKTPTLVARLMGLDLLPENIQSSPSSSSSTPNLSSRSTQKTRQQQHKNRSASLKTFMDSTSDNNFTGTKSLPETPRISAARKSSDSDINVDHHHRLSLQIIKEEIQVSRLRRKYHHHQDHTEKENVVITRMVPEVKTKQVKESRKNVGLVDITNTIKSRDNNYYYSINQTSCSPRLRFSDNKNKTNMPTSNNYEQTTKPSPNPVNYNIVHSQSVKPKPVQREDNQNQRSKKKKNKSNSTVDRFGLVKNSSRNKQEEPFVRAPNPDHHNKKCKKTPLSSELLNISSVPTLLHHVKKDPSTKKLVSDAQESKQKISSSRLSSCPSQNKPHVSRDNNGYTTTSTTVDGGGGGAELQAYVTRILISTGIKKDTPLSLSTVARFQFSHSQPINPSIFNHIELVTKYDNLTGGDGRKKLGLGLRCNRELTFHLVNEVLVQILKPYVTNCVKPWVNNRAAIINSKQVVNGSDLIEILCSKIREFPCADCQVLEDIDALINGDWPPFKEQTNAAFEDEGDGIVTEIEEEILEALIHETAALAF